MQLMTLFHKIFDLSVGEDVNWTAFWLVMILMYINIGLYIMDLYALVKKKTPEETVLIMLLPGTIIVMATAVFTLCLQIPASPYLEKVWREMVSPGLWVELLFEAALFVFFWGLAWKLWRKKQKSRLQIFQWIFSYSPDLVMAALLAVVGCAGLAGGVDLVVLAGSLLPGLGYNLFLYLFLYGTAALGFKVALILLAGLTRLCTVRIFRFPYREGGHPAASFLVYGTLCQNARLRGVLAFWIPGMCFAGWMAVAVDGIFAIRIFFPMMCGLGFLLCLLIACRPLADDMARFARWGDRKAVLARFCREYFLEEPLLKTEDFTVTRHYLADERGMLEVFSFEALEKIDGSWVSDPKKGWVRKLTFQDGGCCMVTQNDQGADALFRYAKQYWEMQRLAAQGGMGQRMRPIGREGLYYKVLYFVVAAMVMLLFGTQQML